MLGVDNDSVLCESVRVPLSSVCHDLEGMAYQGSDQVFKEKPADSDSSTETFDPEKAKQEAYEDYMR